MNSFFERSCAALVVAFASASITSVHAEVAPVGGAITAVYQPLNEQLEVFWVSASGKVFDIWKDNNGPWHDPIGLTDDGAAPPNARLSVVWQVQDEHLESFWVGANGAVDLIWKEHNGPWHAPAQITGPGFANPGTPLASVWQPVRHELMVFGIANNGTLNMVWKKDESNWMVSPPMSAPGFGVAGEQLSAVYQPLHEHIEVFAVGPNGAIDDEWKSADQTWAKAGPLTGPGAAPVGAALSALWMDRDEHIEVLFVGADGSYNTLWKAHDGPWALLRASGPGAAPSAAPISSTQQPNVCCGLPTDENQQATAPATSQGQLIITPGPINTNDTAPHDYTEVFAIGADGAINLMRKMDDGGWHAVRAVAPAGSAPPGNDIKAVLEQAASQVEVIYQDKQGALWDTWKHANNGYGTIRLTNPGGASATVDNCMQYFRNWYSGGPFLQRWADSCKAQLPKLCRRWRLRGSTFNAVRKDLKDGKVDYVDYLTMTLAQTDKGTASSINYGGVVGWMADSPDPNYHNGGTSDWLDKFGHSITSNGKLYYSGSGTTQGGSFDYATGNFMLKIIFFHIEDDRQLTENYFGHIGTVSLGGGALVAGLEGGYSNAYNDSESDGSWNTFEYAGLPNAVFCEAQDVVFNPPPPPPPPTKPIKTTGRPKAPSSLPTTPSPAAGVSFSSEWVTQVQNGVIYVVGLNQDQTGHVTGSYSAGSISGGVVVGHDLFAHWTQGGSSGTLQFHMAPDNTTFAGMWTLGDVMPTSANAQGTWDGYNSAFYTKPDQQGDFSGGFVLSRGDGASVPLQFALTGSDASGAYAQGTIAGPVAHFQGRPTMLTAVIVDSGHQAHGTFYLYPDGTGFSGYWHTGANDIAAWSGRSTMPVSAPGASPLPVNVPVATMTPMIPALPAGPPVQQPVPVQVQQPAPPPPPPVIKIPRGECPAAQATVTQQVNVRDGENGAVLPPPLAGGILVQCTACDSSWCLIADSNPHATVSRKYLDFAQAAQAAQQPAPPVQQLPVPLRPQLPAQQRPPPPAPSPPVVNANFNGVWTVVSDKNWKYYMGIGQEGSTVTGDFTDQEGRKGKLSGTVSGRVFTYTWSEDGGYSGTGTFTLSPDPHRMDGTYTSNSDGSRGTWVGTFGVGGVVSAPNKPAPLPPPTDFGACPGCGRGGGDIIVK